MTNLHIIILLDELDWALFGPGLVWSNPMGCCPYILNHWISVGHTELNGLGQLDLLGAGFDHQIIQNMYNL